MIEPIPLQVYNKFEFSLPSLRQVFILRLKNTMGFIPYQYYYQCEIKKGLVQYMNLSNLVDFQQN